MKNFVITIARGFGSGGRVIGGLLADELKTHSYENRIMTLASQYSGYPEHYFKEANETLTTGDNWFAQQLQKLPKKLQPTGRSSAFVSDDKLFEAQKMIIENLAETETCVIVGKCADYILQDRDNVFSVYIEAPRDYCRQRVMDRMDDITIEEANELITKTDKYRAEYYQHYTGKAWTKVTNYDLTLNNGRLGDDKCVQIIIEAMKVKFGKDFEDYLKSIGK